MKLTPRLRLRGRFLRRKSFARVIRWPIVFLELNTSRSAARRGVDGEAILLPDQDRTVWDRSQIQRGLFALDQARKLGGGAEPYALQAAIAACHARAPKAEDTDWQNIVALYDVLLKTKGSPIVALNRAVAVGIAQGPAAGLAAIDMIARRKPSKSFDARLP